MLFCKFITRLIKGTIIGRNKGYFLYNLLNLKISQKPNSLKAFIDFFSQIDPQEKMIACMENMFDSVLQIQVWPDYILQVVVLEYPATMHCTNGKIARKIHCTARVRRLQFYAQTLVCFYNIFSFLKYELFPFFYIKMLLLFLNTTTPIVPNIISIVIKD